MMSESGVSRRRFLQQSAATGGALAALSNEASAEAQSDGSTVGPLNRKPNILFIMTDQQRFDCLGANGNPVIQTPELDQLAANSANLQNAFVQSPVCVPSRGCFFSGRYAHSHRNRVNYTPMPPGEVLLQRYLRDADYETASIGKLHLYPPTKAEARRTGFSRVQLHDGVRRTDEYSDYAKWRAERDPNSKVHYREYARDITPGENPFRSVVADEFTDTTWVGAETRQMLTEFAKQPKPFFLYSSFWKPHSPYEVPVSFDTLYDDVDIPLPKPISLDEIHRMPLPLQKLVLRFTPQYDMNRTRLQWIYRSYYASISHIDREVGCILQTLEEAGAAKNTIVVFASDHGDQLLDHGFVGKNSFYEESVRVPFLVSFPGRVKPGVYNELIESVDLLPSLFEAIGLDEPKCCQGRSFWPLISDSGRPFVPNDTVYSENVIPEVITNTKNMTFRYEKGKGIAGIRHPDAKMVRTQKWKLNHYPERFGELYDLENDPGEHRNLYGQPQHAAVVSDLKDRLLDWLITADEADQIAEKWML